MPKCWPVKCPRKPNFASAPIHGVRHDAVQADGREAQRQKSEYSKQADANFRSPERLINDFRSRANVFHSQPRVESANFALDSSECCGWITFGSDDGGHFWGGAYSLDFGKPGVGRGTVTISAALGNPSARCPSSAEMSAGARS